MHILGYLVLTIANVLGFLINLYTFIVAIAVLVSWVRPDPYNPIVVFLRQATEPVFQLARKMIPRNFFRTGIDLSPVVVLLFLIVIQSLVVGLLKDLASLFITGKPSF